MSVETAAIRWNGEDLAPGHYIATETDPWLVDPETGEAVNLEEFEAVAIRKPVTEDVDCECEWSWFPGAFAPVNDENSIQACDSCDRYPGDLETAAAIAAHLTTITGKAYEVWFEEMVKLDPEPWRNPNDGERRARGVKWISGADVFDPRPGYAQNREEYP